MCSFNQFHDISPESSIREVYVDAAERYAETEQATRVALKCALSTLAGKIATTSVSRGTPLVVFNPLSWERSDIASIDLPEGDTQDYTVLDGRTEVLSQVVSAGPYTRQLLFEAKRIPPLGYRTFALVRAQGVSRPEDGSHGHAASLEKDSSRWSSTRTRWIRSIVDKRLGKEILSGYGKSASASRRQKPKYGRVEHSAGPDRCIHNTAFSPDR